MYAVVTIAGKQYRVAEGEEVKVDRLETAEGAEVEFREVLMVGGDPPKIGRPVIDGAVVKAKVLAQAKGEKLIVFKKRKRKGFSKKMGHRQLYTRLKITGVQA